ncbi:MAG: VOC family protein [Rhodobiaceae bacterium]|nr:VOC family protein [Rhodobiaceae bacterium]
MSFDRPTGGAAPTLWFAGEAQAAAEFYVTLLPNSQILSRLGTYGDGPMVVEFALNGTVYLAMNGNPEPSFNDTFSLSVLCADQGEIDRLWDALTEGGAPGRCGWLKDRFGLSWQIVPKVLPELLGGEPQRAGHVMNALMTMDRPDIAALEHAATADRETPGPT